MDAFLQRWEATSFQDLCDELADPCETRAKTNDEEKAADKKGDKVKEKKKKKRAKKTKKDQSNAEVQMQQSADASNEGPSLSKRALRRAMFGVNRRSGGKKHRKKTSVTKTDPYM